MIQNIILGRRWGCPKVRLLGCPLFVSYYGCFVEAISPSPFFLLHKQVLRVRIPQMSSFSFCVVNRLVFECPYADFLPLRGQSFGSRMPLCRFFAFARSIDWSSNALMPSFCRCAVNRPTLVNKNSKKC